MKVDLPTTSSKAFCCARNILGLVCDIQHVQMQREV
jgi:hypothetical protein